MVGFDDVDGEASYLALVINFVNDIKKTYRQDKMAQEIFKNLAEDSRNKYNKTYWLEINGLLERKNYEKIKVPTTFKKTIIQLNHNSEYIRYLGIDKTSDLVPRNLFWQKMKKDISVHVKAYKTCTTKKEDRYKEYDTSV